VTYSPKNILPSRFDWVRYAFVGIAFTLVSCKPSGHAAARADSTGSPIAGRPESDTAVVRITPDSIGPMPTRAPLRELEIRFSGDAHSVWEGEENYYAGMKVSVAGITAVGTQFRDSLELDLPAETWMLSGTQGILPGGVRMTASWSDLRRTYTGRATVEGGERAAIRFCSLPNFVFYMRADGGDLVTDSLGPTNLAPTAQIDRVQIIQSVGGYDECTEHR